MLSKLVRIAGAADGESPDWLNVPGTIETLMAELAAVLLEEFQQAFEGSVLLRFSVEWVHDLDADTVHSH